MVKNPANTVDRTRIGAFKSERTLRTDPSGHMPIQGCGDEGKSACTATLQEIQNYAIFQNEQYEISFPESNFVWKNIPSTLGFQVGAYYQVGAFLEVGQFVELDFLFNWRRGQISVFGVTGPQGYLGTPTLISGGGYAGSNTVYGLSDNEFYNGGAVFNGFTLSGDAIGKVGMAVESGKAIDDTPNIPTTLFIDPISNLNVTYKETNIVLGANAGTNVLDFGVIGGFAGAKELWTYEIPLWPNLLQR